MTLEESTNTSPDADNDIKSSLSTQTDTSISIEEEEPSSLDDSFNTAAEARRNNQQNVNNMGSKPKQTNMSLLSSGKSKFVLFWCVFIRRLGHRILHLNLGALVRLFLQVVYYTNMSSSSLFIFNLHKL